ncbi:MAG: hypothetical protein ACKV2T_27450 [Kofleriaceae bacterium]
MRFQLSLAVLVTACVNTPETPDTADEITSALEQENGGFETTDEAPMFALDDVYAETAIESDSLASDPMEADATIASMEGAPNAEVLDVMMLWGQLPPDPTATVARDWSGELRISRGGMYVRRRLGFEDATDRVLPRQTRDAIQFESRTRPFVDGLALRIVEDPARSTDPLRLTYTPRTGDARELDVTRLRDERRVSIDAGDGNRVIAVATRRNDTCQHGFIRGRWHKIAPNVSKYLGYVANPRGEVVGHIRGIAGQRRNGDAVMFGKFISRDGGFVGLVKGTYENGELHARWIDRTGDHGTINGMYFEGGPNPRTGGFLARWAETSCDAQ